jgi:hypothetical protein
MFDGRGGLATSPDPDGAAAAAPDSTDGVLRRKGRLDSLEELMLLLMFSIVATATTTTTPPRPQRHCLRRTAIQFNDNINDQEKRTKRSATFSAWHARQAGTNTHCGATAAWRTKLARLQHTPAQDKRCAHFGRHK